jgi:hypothetical protein
MRWTVTYLSQSARMNWTGTPDAQAAATAWGMRGFAAFASS